MQSILQQTQAHMEQNNDKANQPKLRRIHYPRLPWRHPLGPRPFEGAGFHHSWNGRLFCQPRIATNRGISDDLRRNRGGDSDPFGALYAAGEGGGWEFPLLLVLLAVAVALQGSGPFALRKLPVIDGFVPQILKA